MESNIQLNECPYTEGAPKRLWTEGWDAAIAYLKSQEKKKKKDFTPIYRTPDHSKYDSMTLGREY